MSSELYKWFDLYWRYLNLRLYVLVPASALNGVALLLEKGVSCHGLMTYDISEITYNQRRV